MVNGKGEMVFAVAFNQIDSRLVARICVQEHNLCILSIVIFIVCLFICSFVAIRFVKI